MANQVDQSNFNEYVFSKIDELLEYFQIEYNKYHNRYSFPCPIHGGDRNEACVIYTKPSNEGYVGNWICYTQHCEQEFGKGIVGFIRGLLSQKEVVSYADTIKWLTDYFKLGIATEHKVVNPYNDSKFITALYGQNYQYQLGANRQQVRNALIIPARNYLERGYTKEILDKYDVGFCCQAKKPMFNRIVFPVYDESGSRFIGCIGRSQNPQCKTCKKYHFANRACPETPQEVFWSSKWINSPKFCTYYYFYNIWLAKKHIQRYNTVILVEGQGDVLKLEQSGIHLALGLFGDSLTDYQRRILYKLPIHNIIISTDNDTAGINAKNKISEQLKNQFNLYYVNTSKKDFGDSSTEEIQDKLMPLLGKICNYTKEL